MYAEGRATATYIDEHILGIMRSDKSALMYSLSTVNGILPTHQVITRAAWVRGRKGRMKEESHAFQLFQL